jgi:hypothetical protein
MAATPSVRLREDPDMAQGTDAHLDAFRLEQQFRDGMAVLQIASVELPCGKIDRAGVGCKD